MTKKEIVYCRMWTSNQDYRDLTRKQFESFDFDPPHRTNGPACEFPEGTKGWYQNGKCHRLGGPAVIRPDGYKEWCINGQLHRIDGPACEWSSGRRKWFIHGRRLNTKDVEEWLCENDIDLSTQQGQTAFILKWS